MSLYGLIWRNLKKNLKNYYLYVFALIFSVMLYFSFVTLLFDPALDPYEGSVKGGAALRAASVLLVAIVAVFVLYANNIFIKRRSKEIGLFQLIGLTKGKIFRILSSENGIIYYGSLLLGILFGFSISRLILMILFKIVGAEAEAKLNFSTDALIQTVAVFTAIYVLIMVMNFMFIARQSILSLFRVVSTAQTRVKKLSFFEILIGLLGIGAIGAGYYVSTKLFGGDFVTLTELYLAMVSILGSVIVGTYLLYKGSVSFVFNLIRKSKGGYLSVKGVLSLSSIMFRMKSNALLLTVITTVSALAIGLLSLSYISYYSAEKSARQSVPNHFAILDEAGFAEFAAALSEAGIEYEEVRRDAVIAETNAADLIGSSFLTGQQDETAVFPVVSERSLPGLDVEPDKVLLAGYNDAMMQFLSLKSSGTIGIQGNSETFELDIDGLRKDPVLSIYFTASMPTAVVDHAVYERLAADPKPELQLQYSTYLGIDIVDSAELGRANEAFHRLDGSGDSYRESQPDLAANQKSSMGLMMFIVGFLGLTFLITSGCILYFKQMDESEEERPSYTILRKLGFTRQDLLGGIRIKQLFNFGIPLAVGLAHSYFAVKSGWFFFGTELWAPMVLVMLLYTALYSVFGLLSVLYSKRVIKESL